MISVFIICILLILAIITLNNKWLNQNVSYMLSGIFSFLFVIVLIFSTCVNPIGLNSGFAFILTFKTSLHTLHDDDLGLSPFESLYPHSGPIIQFPSRYQ